MSDSELSDAPSVSIPPDKELRDSLRRETQKAVEAGGDVTVRAVRDASVKELGLPDQFYTSDKWKSISKDLIREEHDRLQNAASAEPQQLNQIGSKSQTSKPLATSSRTTKRPSLTENTQPRKKAKPNRSTESSSVTSAEPSDADHDEKRDEGVRQSKTPTIREIGKSKSQPPQRTEQHDSDPHEMGGSQEDRATGSESETSVVIDDKPVKQRPDKSKHGPEKNPTKTKSVKVSSNNEADPDKDEIKKLQSWLVKCGVRKVWGKELKPYETNKAKIRHLRDMLADVGMTGRFSNEKAAQIKEARELAADIEEVQQGAQRWGKSEDEDDDDGGNRTRGGRRLVRGSKHYDFLSSDGEETD